MESTMVRVVAAVLILGQTVTAGVPLISSDAFVRLSVDMEEVALPDSFPLTEYQGNVRLNTYVVANCRHSMGVAFRGFVREDGLAIGPEDTSVAVGRVAVPVGDGPVVPVHYARRTPREGISIPLDLWFRVGNLRAYPAGKYSGSLEVAVLANE